MLDLQDVLARLYHSEINCSVESFWDGGWTVKLGDDMNGYKAETTIWAPPLPDAPEADRFRGRTVDETKQGLAAVAEWLDEQARIHFPDSDYAKKPARAALSRQLADVIRETHLAPGRTVTDDECLDLLIGGSQADFVRLLKAEDAIADALGEIDALRVRAAQMANGLSEYEANEDAWPDDASRERHNRVETLLAAREETHAT